MFFHKNSFLLFILFLTIKLILSQPESDLESQKLFSDIHNSKYLWGTYKPNLYFSMKQKKKETPVFGIMWYGLKDKNYFSSKVDISEILRHECAKTDSIKYYWPYHNGKDYANEIIKDEDNNIIFDIQNIKTNYDLDQQSWINVINAKKINKDSIINKINNIGIILYFSLEEFSLDKKAIFNADNIKLTDTNYELKEMRLGEEIEKFDVEITEGKEGIKYSQYQKYRKGYQYNWRVKQFVVESLKYHQEKYAKDNLTYSYIPFDEMAKTKQPNIIAIQIVFNMNNLPKDNFEIIIRYSNNKNKQKETKEYINEIINKKRKEFNIKFNQIFNLKNIE
jgi:mannosyl-oligosaccharide glucosidase